MDCLCFVAWNFILERLSGDCLKQCRLLNKESVADYCYRKFWYGHEKVPHEILYNLQTLSRIFGYTSPKEFILNDIFDEDIHYNTLPNTLTHLVFGWKFNRKIKPSVLPASLIYLKLDWRYNQPFGKHELLPSLIYFESGWFYNQSIESYVLPSSLIYLKFGHGYNQPILPNVLPASLRHLHFNHFIGSLFLEGSPLSSISLSVCENHSNKIDDKYDQMIYIPK